MTVPGQPRGETAPAGGAAAFEAQALRRRFDADREQLIGLEEEVMAVDPRTLDLLPRAAALLALPGGEDPRFKLELPASQIEIVTAPHRTVGELVAELTGARRALACAAGGEAAFLAAGVHPFAPAEGELNAGAHYAEVAADYGIVARRQLVCGLHVHIALRGAERTLAVYNAMRAYLPMLAALAANAPVHEGRDTGLASIRPLISGMLPRQGVPPPMASWEELAEELAWGARTGRLQRLRGWWWELRVHAELATLEVRVADAQSSVEEVGAVAAVAASLALALADRHDAGELPAPAPSWRIAENRWSAARDGAGGRMYDLASGAPRPTAELLGELLDALEPVAPRIGAGPHLAVARRMIERGGAARQRRALRAGGDARAVARELTALFAPASGETSG